MAHDSQIVRAKENLKLSHGGSSPSLTSNKSMTYIEYSSPPTPPPKKKNKKKTKTPQTVNIFFLKMKFSKKKIQYQFKQS